MTRRGAVVARMWITSFPFVPSLWTDKCVMAEHSVFRGLYQASVALSSPKNGGSSPQVKQARVGSERRRVAHRACGRGEYGYPQHVVVGAFRDHYP